MEIRFNLPNVFNPEATRVDNAYALRSLLDCLIAINLGYLRFHAAPPLYESGVKYGRTLVWEPIPALFLPDKFKNGFYWEPSDFSTGKRRGDCKSLSAALIAEYMNKGIQAAPVFRWRPREDGSGMLDFHILVQTNKGVEDPSKVLGMGRSEWSRFYK